MLQHDPSQPQRALIVVSKGILPGIIASLHLSMQHATKHQLKLIFERYFFGIKSSDVISRVVGNCELCKTR